MEVLVKKSNYYRESPPLQRWRVRQRLSGGEDKPMAIDPKEIDSIEDSMVHDVDEEPKPEGMGVYLTLRFLSEVVLGVYGVMLLGMVVVQAVLRHGEQVPVFLMLESVLPGLPIALVAAYFYFVTDHEPDIAKMRKPLGKVVTFVITFVVMQVLSVLLWVALAKAFSLH